MNDIKFSVNDKKKTVKLILDIECSPDMKDERYISYMPKIIGRIMDEVLRENVKEDVINESKKSEAYKMAEDNLEAL